MRMNLFAKGNINAVNISDGWNLKRVFAIILSVIFTILFVNSFLYKMDLEWYKYYGIVAVILVLLYNLEMMIVEHFVKWIVSILKRKANANVKIAYSSLVIFIMAFSMSAVIDFFGVIQTKDLVSNIMISTLTKLDDRYKARANDIANGSIEKEQYNRDMAVYQQERAEALSAKEEAIASCNGLPSSYRTKKMQCKKEALNTYNTTIASLVKPTLSETAKIAGDSSSEVLVDASTMMKIRAEKEELIQQYEWVFYVVFGLFAGLAALLKIYAPLTEFFDRKRRLDEDGEYLTIVTQEIERLNEIDRDDALERKELNTKSKEDFKKAERFLDKIKLETDFERMKKAIALEYDNYKNVVEKNGDILMDATDEKGIPIFPVYVGGGETITEKVAAKSTSKEHGSSRPIGFDLSDSQNTTAPTKPNPPTHTTTESGYFDDGYDLTLAILCLFNFGEREAGDELLTNKQMHALYIRHPKKRNELVFNQISKMVKEPLKLHSLISSKAGHPDQANHNIDVVLDELGLLPYWSEITS